MNIIYNYNHQIDPPGPMVNVVIRSTIAGEKFMASPALVDYGADYSAITPEIFKRLMPPRNGTVYIESYGVRVISFLFIQLTLKYTIGCFEKLRSLLGMMIMLF